MIILDCEQYSDEHRDARLGIPTASQFSRIITATGKPHASAMEYVYELAREAVTREPTQKHQSFDMQEGRRKEPLARNYFEFIYDAAVRQVGLIYKDEQKCFAASPDGLLDGTGLEIFCPKFATHMANVADPENAVKRANKIQQIQGSLFISEFDYWWFCSYWPPEDKPTVDQAIFKVYRDEPFIAKLEAELEKFVIELAVVTRKLKAML